MNTSMNSDNQRGTMSEIWSHLSNPCNKSIKNIEVEEEGEVEEGEEEEEEEEEEGENQDQVAAC